MRLHVLLTFTTLALCASARLLDYRLALSPFAAALKDCTKPGPLCETCQSLVACVDEDGTWRKNTLATCRAPSFCVDGVCTSDYDPFCWGVADRVFPCQIPGVFPDPFYCNKYNLCTTDGKTVTAHLNTCSSGFGFNIGSDLCNVRLENQECPLGYPVPLCEKAGQTGAIAEKPAMYYLCQEMSLNTTFRVLYPYLNLCPGDDVYVDYQCTRVTVSSTGVTDPPTSTSEPTTTPPTTPTTSFFFN